jgi:hypothetical protein
MGSIRLSLSEAVLQAIADALIHRMPHADRWERLHICQALRLIDAMLKRRAVMKKPERIFPAPS